MFTKSYSTLQSALKSSKMQKTRLKLFAIIVGFLITALSSPAVATVYKQINFEWEYDTSLSGLSGYILYQDEQHLQTITDKAVLSMDLSVGLEPGHITAFTMKAFDEDGNESAISAPYSLDVPVAVENNNFLPTVLLNLSALSGDAPLEVEFSAVGSTDFDGTIVSYEWNLGDGGISSSVSGIYTFVSAGTYTVTLTATDNDSGVSVAQRTVTVSGVTASNVPPTAHVSLLSVSSGQAPLLVEFSPQGSMDSDGTIAFYAWDFGDGESALTSTASHVSHAYTIAGTYAVTLTVTDNAGGVAMAQASVIVTTPPPNVAPTAMLNLSTSSAQAPMAVEFSAEGSSDSDGTIISYLWDFGDGGTAVTPTANYTYNIAGIYTVTLTVRDNHGTVGKAQNSVTVLAANKLPTATVTLSPQSGKAPFDVGFSASGSTDVDGTIVSYAWTFGDGGFAVTDVGNHTFTAAGVYIVTLTVTDNNGGVSKAQGTVTVSPANKVPTALLTLSTLTGKAPLAMDFSAASSTDTDGTIVKYAWDFGDQGTAVSSTGSHSYSVAGTYPVTLTVTDNEGAVGKATTTVMVSAANKVPTALLTLSTLMGKAPLAIDFSAASSTDTDGTIVNYAWDFGDQGTAASSTGSHTYGAAGTYPVTLKVTDNEGAVGTATTTVTVAAANKVPTALLTLSTLTGKAPLAIDFSATKSTDTDGTIVKYAWDFGDQGTAVSSTGSHTYSAAGTYPVTLTVTDNEGAVGKATTTVTVSAANKAPTALFNPTVTSGIAPLLVSFDATPSSDVDGEVTSYFWTFGDGSSTAGSSEVSHSFTKAGSFPVKLTVTDNDGAQAFYEKTIVASLPALPVYPLADFMINPQDPMVKQLVQFSGSASKAAAGRKIIHYLWTFGDGKSATGIITSYRYRVAGTYTVQLTVWDDLGVSNKKSVTLTVKNVVR